MGLLIHIRVNRLKRLGSSDKVTIATFLSVILSIVLSFRGKIEFPRQFLQFLGVFFFLKDTSREKVPPFCCRLYGSRVSYAVA